ncbi:Cysteine protease [Entamoeba marina]
MSIDINIYYESQNHIPFLQKFKQKTTNACSMVYNQFQTPQSPAILYPTSPIILLGKTYQPYTKNYNTNSFTDIPLTHPFVFNVLTNLIYFVYRTKFNPLPNTTLTSDCPWGCTIRATQMLLANSLSKLYETQAISKQSITSQFLDFMDDQCPFSIHRLFLTNSIVLGSVNGNSFLPPTLVCSAFTQLITESTPFTIQLITHTFQIKSIEKPCIICVSYTLPDSFDNLLENVYSYHLFSGMVGGSHKKAFYFIGKHTNQHLFLDPHVVKQTCSSPTNFDLNDYKPMLQNIYAISSEHLDRSVVFAFTCQTNDDMLDCKNFCSKVLGITDAVVNYIQEECGGFEILNMNSNN